MDAHSTLPQSPPERRQWRRRLARLRWPLLCLTLPLTLFTLLGARIGISKSWIVGTPPKNQATQLVSLSEGSILVARVPEMGRLFNPKSGMEIEAHAGWQLSLVPRLESDAASGMWMAQLPLIWLALPSGLLTFVAFRNAPARTYVPRCPRCRYELTGLTTDVCPECGSPVNATASARSASKLTRWGRHRARLHRWRWCWTAVATLLLGLTITSFWVRAGWNIALPSGKLAKVLVCNIVAGHIELREDIQEYADFVLPRGIHRVRGDVWPASKQWSLAFWPAAGSETNRDIILSLPLSWILLPALAFAIVGLASRTPPANQRPSP